MVGRLLATLVSAVGALAATGDDLSHQRVVRALRALGDVIDQIPGRSEGEGAEIRDAADRLAASEPTSLEHLDIVREALRKARHALDARGDVGRPELARALLLLDDTLDRFDAARPLLDQQSLVVTAFEIIGNSIAVAEQVAPPFALPHEAPTGVRSRADAMRAARADVLAAARANWTSADGATAKVLEDLADLIDSSPRTQGAGSAEVRLQAGRLRRAGTSGFDEQRWIKVALLAALVSLEGADAASIDDARAAVVNIDDHKGAAFQRGTIQDALRATVDAFLFAGADTRAGPVAPE